MLISCFLRDFAREQLARKRLHNEMEDLKGAVVYTLLAGSLIVYTCSRKDPHIRTFPAVESAGNSERKFRNCV
jgi:hypothetical protein